ncbi:MAG: EamA family transporter [Anaerolineae bacterium]|nr:EamA family transporter [Anaerolineae bacterium]
MPLKWAAFWMLGLIWGSSFLLIRIGVEAVSPFQLVFMRTAIAAIGLNLVLYSRGHWARLVGGIRPLALIGVAAITVPFALITWGEQVVDSGTASVLTATDALFTLLISALVFRSEPFTTRKLVGVLIGLIGMVILTGRSLVGDAPQTASLPGQAAILLAALFYAFSDSYAYRLALRWDNWQMVAAGSMLFAAITSGVVMLLSPALGGPALTPLHEIPSDALLAILTLGVVNTFLSYLVYYWMIRQLGASRASMVTYVAPVVGLALGALILSETLDAQLLLGAALILSGIAAVNLRLRWRRSAPPIAPRASQLERVS